MRRLPGSERTADDTRSPRHQAVPDHGDTWRPGEGRCAGGLLGGAFAEEPDGGQDAGGGDGEEYRGPGDLEDPDPAGRLVRDPVRVMMPGQPLVGRPARTIPRDPAEEAVGRDPVTVRPGEPVVHLGGGPAPYVRPAAKRIWLDHLPAREAVSA